MRGNLSRQSAIPKHWVIVDIVTRAGQCTPGHLDKMLKIQDTLPVGATLNVCLSSPEQPDSGWLDGSGEKTVRRLLRRGGEVVLLECHQKDGKKRGD